MAFINCSKCGKRVSDKTQTCIHCGAAVTKSRVEKAASTYTAREAKTADDTSNEAEYTQNPKETNTSRKIKYVKRKCSYCGGYSTADETHCLCCGARYEGFAVEEEVKKEEPPKTKSVENVSQHSYRSNQTTTTQSYVTYSTDYQPLPKMKRKWVAFWLCFFLGMFGAHKFYEGKTGMGILYLFTAGLFGFGWIYDCVVYLLKKGNTYEVK